MTKQHLVVLVCLTGITAALWAAIDRPVAAPVWDGRIAGFAYSPLRPSERPGRQKFPDESALADDMALLAHYTDSIRTYSIDGTLSAIPRLARDAGLTVAAGIWLGQDSARNRRQVEALIRLVAANENVTRVIIGNETQLTGSIPDDELIGLLDMARDALDVPVSTAEPWHIWLGKPELVDHVDYLTVHLLPYWEGVSADSAISLVEQRMDGLEHAFPDIPIVIGEVGWPSNGRSRDAARASPAAAETFLRNYLQLADQHAYDYFLMEAIDQPWKQSAEGTVGAHWGWFDADRAPKYSPASAFSRLPDWPAFAAASVALFLLAYWMLRTGAGTLDSRGLWLLGLTAAPVANASVAAIADQAARYWTIGSALAAGVLALGIAGLTAVLFVEVREWAEARFGKRKRLPLPRPGHAAEFVPKVSIHVPIHAEPPAMVVATLEALARLEYPSYEVVVVDNNTADSRLWQPVADCCRRLGRNFRFFHVAPLDGYKAGALNYALERTAADAGIIAVIDSDYCVEPSWLHDNVHHFANRKVAIVQAPQSYRDGSVSAFKRLCAAEYRGFFDIGMPTRNDRNAIIQHGTMTLVRASALREVGGWAEWTVTEDAELGLRILAAGYEAIYTKTSYGRGLTPDSFRDYRAQRHRWALGAVQILRRHGGLLLGLEPGRLTFGQRVQFLAGWLPWLGDGLNLVFNIVALGWSALMIADPARFNPPLAFLSAFVLAAFSFKLLKTVALYRWHIGATWRDTIFACLAGLALIHVVGQAVVAGLSRRAQPFFRTPKLARPDGRLAALLSVASEAFLGTVLAAAAAGVIATAPFASIDLYLWICLLAMFALPNATSVAIALLAAGSATVAERSASVGRVSPAERF